MRQAYRPDIDGLRAVAVLSVIFYHYQLGVSGGFTGVDVFFVISGFLITSNLKSDIAAGKFSILGFYDRRIRRIVPALLTVLAAALIAGWLLLIPGDYDSLGHSAAFAAFGLSNFFFLWHTGYFDRAAEMQPLLHTWSLGVEEQFYLVWPPLLWLGMKLVPWKRVFITLFGLALALSFAYAVVKVQGSPKEAFYLPHPRAWELAVGGILAFLPAIDQPRLAAIMEIIAVSLLCWSFFGLSPADTFPGINALYSCVGAALLIWPKPQWMIASSLAIRPLRGIGLISYSLYLWHWPVLVFFRTYNNGALPSLPQALSLVVLSIALAAASYWLVEQPIRRMRPIRWKTVATGLACCATIAASGAGIHSAAGFASRVSPKVAALSSLKVMWQWKCPDRVTLDGYQYCSFGAPWATAKEHAMLWGDSHAQVMAPIVQAAYRGQSVSFILFRWCPAVLGDGLSAPKNDEPDYAAHCREQHRRAYKLLHGHRDIDLVMFSASWFWLGKTIYRDDSSPIDGDHAIVQQLTKVISDTSDEGRKFVIVSDWPYLPHDPVGCEIGQQSGLPRASCADFGREMKVYYGTQQRRLRDGFAEIGRSNPNVKTLFAERPFCGKETCSLRFDGEYMYRDVSHLRRNLPPSVRLAFAQAIGLPVVWDDISAQR